MAPAATAWGVLAAAVSFRSLKADTLSLDDGFPYGAVALDGLFHVLDAAAQRLEAQRHQLRGEFRAFHDLVGLPVEAVDDLLRCAGGRADAEPVVGAVVGQRLSDGRQ